MGAVTSETSSRRCVLLFALPARQEAHAKRLSRAEALFAYSRRRIAEAVSALSGVDLLVLPQRGQGFAERLENAFADARALGYREVVAVPGDVPRLGAAQLARAFALLAERPIVLGPSPDGGIYLLGCSIDPQPFLAGVHWHGAGVFAELVALARPTGGAGVLEALEDLDRPGDLVELARRSDLEDELARLLAGMRPAAPTVPSRDRRAPRRLLLSSRLLTRGPPSPPSLPR